MKKQYSSPTLVAYGDISQVTGYFGVNGADDVFIDNNGNDVSGPEDSGSTDACASNDLEHCK